MTEALIGPLKYSITEWNTLVKSYADSGIFVGFPLAVVIGIKAGEAAKGSLEKKKFSQGICELGGIAAGTTVTFTGWALNYIFISRLERRFRV